MLPPNEEWAKPLWDSGKIRLSFLKTDISATETSVAVVSFRLALVKDENEIAAANDVLNRMPASESAARKRIERMIAERAMHFDLFATLARRDGKWKIVCMSLPE